MQCSSFRIFSSSKEASPYGRTTQLKYFRFNHSVCSNPHLTFHQNRPPGTINRCYYSLCLMFFFLFLLCQSGIFYLHTSVLLIISLHLSTILNHTFSSQFSLPSHPAPVPPIRSLRYGCSINLVVYKYVRTLKSSYGKC